MRYLFTNEILDAVLSATNGNTNYPVRNLQDRFLQKRFQSSGEISQITSLMNTVKDVNCIVHGHTNATSIYSYLYSQGQFIGQAYTNLVTDPCDLTTANWTNTNSTDELTGIEINGHKFTKIINSGVNAGYVKQVFTAAFSNLILTGQVILRNGDIANNQTKFTVRNTTGAVNIVEIAPDFDNYPNAPANMSKGTLLDYEWIDSETLKMNFECDALANLTDDVELRCYGANLPVADEYTYWTEVQLIDEADITMFPFVDGTHAADVIDETFTMPDKFVMDMTVEPKLAYDTSVFHVFYMWYIDSTHKFQLNYDASANDRFYLTWQDGGTVTYLYSDRFDNGTSHININQKLRFIILANLISGGQTDSGLIIIEEDGTVHEYTSWTIVNPDVKSSNFPTMRVGSNQVGGAQADSECELFHIYSWDGTKPTITSSEDADAYFSDKTPSFEFEPDSVLFKESITHNLNSDTDFTYLDEKLQNIKQIVTTIEGPDPVYLGGIGAGEYYQMPDPEEAFSLSLQDNSYYEQSPSGQVLSNYEEPLKVPEWTFNGVTNDIANEIRLRYIEIGKGFPFYADFFEDNRDFYEPLYCFFTSEPGDNKNSRRRDYSVNLMEAR